MDALNSEQARFNMIEQQIRPWDVLDDRVLETLAAMPREDFVPERYRALAFSDISIPLEHEQVMMPPRLEGRLLQSLFIQPDDEILEIGTGSGYLTACLARLGGRVRSVDLYQDFIDGAAEKVQHHGLGAIEFECADAASGYPGEAVFDAIAVTGSLPLLHQGFHRALKVGGRLFVIVGQPPVMQALLITRTGEQEWIEESLFETSLPALVNAPQPEPFHF
ncbi:MAG TPA: protein-L-isoaspartate O-methyltransferase [Gammaproteobacteria bacterium]|nr:protein-L-isoaspartate O-methyltransferase [Gammaproteobacteria bacterium]